MEPETAAQAPLDDAQTLAEALPHLRRLAECETLPQLSRCAADVLARTVERLAPSPALRAIDQAPARSDRAAHGDQQAPILTLAR